MVTKYKKEKLSTPNKAKKLPHRQKRKTAKNKHSSKNALKI